MGRRKCGQSRRFQCAFDPPGGAHNWGGCHLCASNVDDDNFVGFADLAAVLADWGVCP